MGNKMGRNDCKYHEEDMMIDFSDRFLDLKRILIQDHSVKVSSRILK